MFLELSSNDRLKFRTITTIDVHARDIIEGFVRDNVTEAAEFEWESQLRFYWQKKDDNLWVKQCTGTDLQNKILYNEFFFLTQKFLKFYSIT